MCFGASGSGKTSAMNGPEGFIDAFGDCIDDVRPTLFVSYLEISFDSNSHGRASHEVRDLLASIEKRQIGGIVPRGGAITVCSDTGEIVHNARVFKIDSGEQLWALHQAGEARVHVASTQANTESSRSQKILICVSPRSFSLFGSSLIGSTAHLSWGLED